MRKLLVWAASAAFLALQASGASAAIFNWSYTDGGSNVGSGTFTASQDLGLDPTGNTYLVSGVTGTANGESVGTVGSFFGTDQLIFPASPRLVDRNGVGFFSALSGFALYEDDGGYAPGSEFACGDIYCLITGPANQDSHTVPIAVNLSITAADTPLPGALPLFASGLAGLGLFGLRRKRKAQTS